MALRRLLVFLPIAALLPSCCGYHFMQVSLKTDEYVAYAKRTTQRTCDPDAPLHFYVAIVDRKTDERVVNDMLTIDDLPKGMGIDVNDFKFVQTEDGIRLHCTIKPDNHGGPGVVRVLNVDYRLKNAKDGAASK